jgi:hypothetical protein
LLLDPTAKRTDNKVPIIAPIIAIDAKREQATQLASSAG